MNDFKFKIDGKEYAANVEEKEDGKLAVTVNGKAYEVEVEGHKAAAPKVQPIKPAVLAQLSQLLCPVPSPAST